MNFMFPIVTPLKVSFCLTSTSLRSTVVSREKHSDPRQKLAVRHNYDGRRQDKLQGRQYKFRYLRAKRQLAPLGINRSRHADEGK
jgi:hypothetical protein